MTERENEWDRQPLIEPFAAILGDDAIELLVDLDIAQFHPSLPLVVLEELERDVEAQLAEWELAGDVGRLAAFCRALVALAQITACAE